MVAVHTTLLRHFFPDPVEEKPEVLSLDKILHDLQVNRSHLRLQSTS